MLINDAYAQVETEKDTPENQLTSGLNDGEKYMLRWWFRRYKEYIVSDNGQWTDDDRRREVAMHSGGIGCQAATTLYRSATYLYHATNAFEATDIGAKKTYELSDYLRVVKERFEKIEFYPETQNSIGVSMRTSTGKLKNYREFGEAITDQSQRGWFMTLADVYVKLDRRDRQDIEAICDALGQLIGFLDQLTRDSPVKAVVSKLTYPRRVWHTNSDLRARLPDDG